MCGTCTACCTALAVKELEKPSGTACEHISPVKGCTIYKDRPKGCQEWSCLWLQGHFEGADRPDRIGVVMDTTRRADHWPDGYAFVAREAVPGGFEKAESLLGALASLGYVVVLIQPDNTRKVIGPAAKVALVQEAIRRFLPVVK